MSRKDELTAMNEDPFKPPDSDSPGEWYALMYALLDLAVTFVFKAFTGNLLYTLTMLLFLWVTLSALRFLSGAFQAFWG